MRFTVFRGLRRAVSVPSRRCPPVSGSLFTFIRAPSTRFPITSHVSNNPFRRARLEQYQYSTSTSIMAAAPEIPPARQISCRAYAVPGRMSVDELFFEVPLDYADPSQGTIRLFARAVSKREVPIVPPTAEEATKAAQKPWLAYLEGGPGFGNRRPESSPLTSHALSRGYQVLFLDYRGTGLSTPVSAAMLKAKGGPAEQAHYLMKMRQDNIVRDCEAVRKCITADYPEEKKKWSTLGQSFGGFVTLSYLSMYPQGLSEVFVTGGLAPVGRSPDEVYGALFKRVIRRNEEYYEKFPEDVHNVRRIAQYIQDTGGSVPLPAGGSLTMQRLLTLGLSLGFHGGFDMIHDMILQAVTDLSQFGFLDRAILHSIEEATSLESNIIYAILHEAIYCYKPGVSSNWAAQSVGAQLDQYRWLADPGLHPGSLEDDDKLYFTGEMIFPFFFDTQPELAQLKEAAQTLASSSDWPTLYDEAQLKRNEVPVYAASFIHDMYVDFDLARETAALVKGTKVYDTNVMYHNALRFKKNEVLGALFSLRDDVLE